MKVALLLTEMDPKSGGGYTFQKDLLESLIQCAEQTEHCFVLLYLSEAPPIPLPKGNFQFLSLHRTVGERLIFKLQGLAAGVHGSTEWIDFRLRKAGVDVILNLRPDPISMETPYINIVWDLQHRLQPFFPEVSSLGEWDKREANYTRWIRRSVYTVVGTETGKKQVMQLYGMPPERIRVLPLPTPSDVLSPAAIRASDLISKFNLPKKFLFYPAQFWPHKNHVNLLLALAYLRDKEQMTLPLALVGSDPGNNAHVSSMVEKLGLAKQVFSLGFVSRPELIALYREAFMLCFVSYFGPDNIPPLEAFALGCPVLASDVMSEQLGDAALLVNPSNPQEIAIGIKRIAQEDSLRQRLLQRGVERARLFGRRNYILGLFKLLEEFAPVSRNWSSQFVLLLPGR